MRLRFPTIIAFALVHFGLAGPALAQIPAETRTKMAAFAERFWKARPLTKFIEWDAAARRELNDQARAFGPIPEGTLADVLSILWKDAAKLGPRPIGKTSNAIPTPYGDATFIRKGTGGKGKALLIGLHGGGEGAGNASEAAGNWNLAGALGLYPQGIRLVHDTWNTVHGEKFVLTLIEIAKAHDGIDPDRVFTMGFSMGGTGSWFMAGRHPDLLAGSSPCAGVIMAEPKSQLWKKEEVVRVQHGLVPNVRNLAMWYYIGLADDHCMPGTYLYIDDMLAELRKEDPAGWTNIHFKTYPGLKHAFPAGEPQAGIKFLEKERRVTFPKKLVWEYASDPQPLPDASDKTARYEKRFFYWLKSREPKDRQYVVAEIKDNVITIEATGTGEGAKGITIFLNDKMIDVKKEVVVKTRTTELYRGTPQPDFLTVFETLDERLDTAMVFDRRIEL